MSLFSNFLILLPTAKFCDKIVCINSVECCSVSVKVPEPAQQGTVWFGSHQRLATCSYSRTTKSRRRNRPKRDTSTKPVDKLQTNKGRKVVRESYDSDTEKAYGWVGPDLFSEFFYTIFLYPFRVFGYA